MNNNRSNLYNRFEGALNEYLETLPGEEQDQKLNQIYDLIEEFRYKTNIKNADDFLSKITDENKEDEKKEKEELKNLKQVMKDIFNDFYEVDGVDTLLEFIDNFRGVYDNNNQGHPNTFYFGGKKRRKFRKVRKSKKSKKSKKTMKKKSKSTHKKRK